jgi:hypothetical protein
MARKYQISAACHRRYGHHRGRASTASGTSQITYCGDHTLFVIRNAARTRKHSCGSRGRRGAARARTVIATHATANKTADIRLRVLRPLAPSSGTPRCSKKYQIEPQSAGRVRLNW